MGYYVRLLWRRRSDILRFYQHSHHRRLKIEPSIEKLYSEAELIKVQNLMPPDFAWQYLAAEVSEPETVLRSLLEKRQAKNLERSNACL